MTTQLKRRIAFAAAMGAVTTGVISFTIITLNLGFTEAFARAWLRSWSLAYVIVIATMLVVGPRVQARIDRLIR